MNPRQRYLATILFGTPDRVPFYPGGPRQDTFNAWHQQGLPKDVDWFQYLCNRIGIKAQPDDLRLDHEVQPEINFAMIPQFEKKALERKNGAVIAQDWKGNICGTNCKTHSDATKRVPPLPKQAACPPVPACPSVGQGAGLPACARAGQGARPACPRRLGSARGTRAGQGASARVFPGYWRATFYRGRLFREFCN